MLDFEMVGLASLRIEILRLLLDPNLRINDWDYRHRNSGDGKA